MISSVKEGKKSLLRRVVKISSTLPFSEYSQESQEKEKESPFHG
ncbi:MAG: hypothetical protein MjAS7_2360 [Metallosphaera javensis (ex Sakai et al. 2022)]|nr:MAG: hypothetical protein MjAS7_2360 [Metallosphaera javensis (ex Sakai et al. 2022)]